MKAIALMAALTSPALASPAVAETVGVDGHDVSYEILGQLANDSVPVLLLHGGAMHTRSTFDQIIPALADRVLIGVEQQGHGHTPINDQPITLDTMRRDTLGVLDAAGVTRAHVVGFSAGGILGIDLAVHAPDRVASLSAVSASQNLDGFLPELARMQREPGYRPPPDIAVLMPSPEEFARMQADVAAMNPGGDDAADQMFAKMATFISSDWGWTDAQLASITAPTLIVIGDNDFIRPDHAVHMADTIPHAWLAILPDTTHMSITAHPALPTMLRHRIQSSADEN